MEHYRSKEARLSGVPALFKQSAQRVASDAVNRFLKQGVRVIGLGSGPMTAAIVREISRLPHKGNLQCVATSTQIKLEAEDGDLKIGTEDLITRLEVVFDGADQVDMDGNMIKGVGGALLREKILHSAAKTVVITAESTKYVESFNRSVPIEIHPFARHIVQKKLEDLGGEPRLRMLDEGYVYVTENGNFILDTMFRSLSEVGSREVELKSIPGVLEVGLFTRRADMYYKAKDDGSFEKIRLRKS
jgi:ribose 5-phosphate isomerase A